MIIDKNIISFSKEVRNALDKNLPLLALESTIIAHGMPYPQNIQFASQAESIARENGAIPATIAIIDGKIYAGLSSDNFKYLANSDNIEKVAIRDIAFTISNKLSGATTVSATMHIARLAGINVFATGGIGGVHRGAEHTYDISQDLIELARTPIVVVSAGAKAILDIPKTLEYLETHAITILGYKNNDFPAFYSRKSGNKLGSSCESVKEIASIFMVHQKLKLMSAILVANPVPEVDEIPNNVVNKYIEMALIECSEGGIEGKAVTPFLLKRIGELSEGETLKANIALALNNVKLGAQIAHQLAIRNK